MTGFNHGLTGALIAITVKQPALAVPLALVIHYPMDVLPHLGFSQDEVLETRFNRLVKTDFVISLALMFALALLFPHHVWLIWVCMIASVIPDLIWFFYRKTVKHWPAALDPFTSWHWHLNKHVDHFNFDIAYAAILSASILIIRF